MQSRNERGRVSLIEATLLGVTLSSLSFFLFSVHLSDRPLKCPQHPVYVTGRTAAVASIAIARQRLHLRCARLCRVGDRKSTDPTLGPEEKKRFTPPPLPPLSA